MQLTAEQRQTYLEILREELVPAMGCTEPIAIAYAASILRDALGSLPTVLQAGFSGNIIKNVKSVVVPMTDGGKGIEVALAAGLLADAHGRRLEVLESLTPEARAAIPSYLARLSLTVHRLESPLPFEIFLTGEVSGHAAQVRITEGHTNVVMVTLDGEDLTARYRGGAAGGGGEPADRSQLSVEGILAYAESPLPEEVCRLLRRQIEMNMAIAEEGLRTPWGASIGRVILGDGRGSLRDRARAYAAAASDARMSGCEKPVCILSGSGNQGITASVPVVIYAREMGASEEELLRALLVSDLITVHQKTGIGCLSAYCGAISAGCGCGCGICYLQGGRYREVAHTLVNSVAILSGTICDGAKSSCAAKIAMAVEAGILGYEMVCAGQQFYGGDGIVIKGVENTLRNVGRLARDGMSETDREIIHMMLESDSN